MDCEPRYDYYAGWASLDMFGVFNRGLEKSAAVRVLANLLSELECIAIHLAFITGFFVILIFKAFQLCLQIVDNFLRIKKDLYNQLPPWLWSRTELKIGEMYSPTKFSADLEDGKFGTTILLGSNGEIVNNLGKEESHSFLRCRCCGRHDGEGEEYLEDYEDYDREDCDGDGYDCDEE